MTNGPYNLAEDYRIPAIGEIARDNRALISTQNDRIDAVSSSSVQLQAGVAENASRLWRLAKIVQENERSRKNFEEIAYTSMLGQESRIDVNGKQIELLFKENERNVRETGRLNKELSGININRIGIVVNFFLIFCILLFIL